MSIKLTTNASERGTYVILATCYNEATPPVAVTPVTFTWTLTDEYGAVVNSRQDVSATPSTSIAIVLTNADLQITGNENGNRHLAIEATYNSTYGTGLSLTGSAEFTIDSILGIPSSS